MSKANGTVQLCRLPDAVKFVFQEGQQMHSLVKFQNVVDKIVTYKIKTNRPGMHLVKPMQGQIFNKSSVNIDFTRKVLAIEDFNKIMNNPTQVKQKFLIEFSCQIEDAVGISQKFTQMGYLGVIFVKGQGDKKPKDDSKNINKEVIIKKGQSKKIDPQQTILAKNQELQKLIGQRQILQAKAGGSACKTTFNTIDLFNVIIVALLAGFVII